MKKLSVVLLLLSIFTVVTTFTLYQSDVDVDKVFASIFIQQNRNATEYMKQSEAKEHSLEDEINRENDHHHKDILTFADFQIKEKDDDSHDDDIVALSEEQIQRMGLEIKKADKGSMHLSLSTRGKITLDPDRLAHVIPKISGIAKEARKNVGSEVKEGEIIAILESEDVAELKTSYLSAINKEKLAASILQRESTLYQKGISAGQDFFDAQHAYHESNIHLKLAVQKLRALGLSDLDILRLADHGDVNLRMYPVYAPINGTVIMRHITQGEYIDNTTPIYEIADFNHLWVETGVYPKDLQRIKEGQVVEIVDPNTLQSAQAKLIFISPMIEDESITARTIALLDNSKGEWRPGSLVKVSIATGHISCPLLISQDAIQKIDGKACAFIETDKGYEKRELQLGRNDEHNVEVITGLLPGEKYVANRSFLLKAEMNKELAKDDD